MKLVLIRARVHPFPFRTRKLSSLLPKILVWRRTGKIGNANTNRTVSTVLFFYIPLKIFVSKKGDKITASNITVNPKLDENKIATAYFQNSADVDLNAVGNSNNIGEMLTTKNELTGKYRGTLGKISSKAASTTSAAEFQESVVQSIENKINEQTGVDMNEELANLVKFQTAFEASARVFNVCNQVLDTLMHLGE